MYKHALVLLLILLLFTGCDANYNLSIDNGKFNENLIVNNVSVGSINDLVLPIYYDVDEYDKSTVKPGDEGFYNAKLGDNNYSLFYNFNYKNFDNSTLINYCYNSIDSYFNKKRYYISTVGDFNCFKYFNNLDSVNVKIFTKYKLIDTNADVVDGFNYIWNINKNEINKGIYLELDLTDKKKSFFDMFDKIDFDLYLVLFSILILGIIVFIIFRNISLKKNKI